MFFGFENGMVVCKRKNGKVVGKFEMDGIVKVNDRLKNWRGKSLYVVKMWMNGIGDVSMIKDKIGMLIIVKGDVDKEGIIWRDGMIVGEMRGMGNVKSIKVWNNDEVGVEVI